MKLRVLEEDTVRRIARIMGSSSAHAAALRDYERRTGDGEPNLGFFLSEDNAVAVGPDPFKANANRRD